MHLLIPHASALSDASMHTLRGLELPQLRRLLSRLCPTQRDGADEYTLTPPHERALAQALGLHGDDGALPWAAAQAAADGVDTQALAWGLLTPVHWQVGRDQVSLVDPSELKLGDAESRQLFDAVRPLFESEGFVLAYGAPLRWYAAHDTLEGLPNAAIDRAIGRNINLWLPQHPQARLIRRLQSEVQMLLYNNAVNDQREARGELPVNSFWLSGCGKRQLTNPAPHMQIDDSLRTPLLRADWAAWADAWRALDAGAIAALNARAAGEPVMLTLCGERYAQRLEPAPLTIRQRLARRWNAPEPRILLETL